MLLKQVKKNKKILKRVKNLCEKEFNYVYSFDPKSVTYVNINGICQESYNLFDLKNHEEFMQAIESLEEESFTDNTIDIKTYVKDNKVVLKLLFNNKFTSFDFFETKEACEQEI
jgi:hypothetical protein